jgi:DNA topoisomerase VI subunit B
MKIVLVAQTDMQAAQVPNLAREVKPHPSGEAKMDLWQQMLSEK